MTFPTEEQYREALVAPQIAFQDAELKQGSVARTHYGLPRAFGGAFALTYCVQAGRKRYAVRVFQRPAPELEQRYQHIAQRLAALKSTYFLPFDFQPRGVLVNGQRYPLLKMAWASGEALSTYLERQHSHPSTLKTLRDSLRRLAAFLEAQGIAHGDIQPGNIMVLDGGKSLQLIDYDGMFVPALRGSRANELGQVNFQHPQRTAQHFDEKLDRFAFIVLDLALQALIAIPGLWKDSRSEHDCVVLRQSDFVAPAQSALLTRLAAKTELAPAVSQFRAIAAAAFAQIPALADFCRSSPVHAAVHPRIPLPPPPQPDAPSLLSAQDYAHCRGSIGRKVQLIGCVAQVDSRPAGKGQTQILIGFAPLSGDAVRLTLRPDCLRKLAAAPDRSWVGSWLSASGTLQTPFARSAQDGSHIEMPIDDASQLLRLTPDQARQRLQEPSPQSSASDLVSRNAAIVAAMERSVARAETLTTLAAEVVPPPWSPAPAILVSLPSAPPLPPAWPSPGPAALPVSAAVQPGAGSKVLPGGFAAGVPIPPVEGDWISRLVNSLARWFLR